MPVVGGLAVEEMDSLAGEPVAAAATFSSNLYSGPGREYEMAGSVYPGQQLEIIGRNEAGDWYLLADGRWIAAVIVNRKADVPVFTEVRGRVIAQVVEVIDGNTITVQVAGQTFPVRYIMSRAPELGQPFGEEAAIRNRELVAGKTVLLERDVSDVDPHGRRLRYVYLEEDDTLVNEELVRLGYAQVIPFLPDVRHEQRLREAQVKARIGGDGLWQAETLPFYETDFDCRYTVQRGDSLLGIARRFSLSVEALAAANSIDNPDLVREGNELELPGCQVATRPGQAPTSQPNTPS
jgi:micrococcal nuclease